MSMICNMARIFGYFFIVLSLGTKEVLSCQSHRRSIEIYRDEFGLF